MNIKNRKSLLLLVTLLVVVAASSLQSFAMYNEEVIEFSRSQYQELTLDTVKISSAMEKILKSSGTTAETYKAFLVEYNVHETYQSELEALAAGGIKVSDLMIVYAFLDTNFGKFSELQGLIESQKQVGWEAAFANYMNAQSTFSPSNFDPSYLDSLLSKSNITADDIMISDMVAQKLELKFDEVIFYRTTGEQWKDIFADLGIARSKGALPRIQITNEDAAKFSRLFDMTENQVLESFILAEKLKVSANDVMLKMRSRQSEEEVTAYYLKSKYK